MTSYEKIQEYFMDSFSQTTRDLDSQTIMFFDENYKEKEVQIDDGEIEVFTSLVDEHQYGFFELRDEEGFTYKVICKVTEYNTISECRMVYRSEFSIYYEPPRDYDPKWDN